MPENKPQNSAKNAIVRAVLPDKVLVVIRDIEAFNSKEDLRIGSFIEISSKNGKEKIVAIIENFRLTASDDDINTLMGFQETATLSPEQKESLAEFEKKLKRYLIEAVPLGLVKAGKFERGGHQITIPPESVEMASDESIKVIYKQPIVDQQDDFFRFSNLVADLKISVPVNGNKFFNKHIGVVGSTGSGKSHTVSTLIQKAINERSESHSGGLNNSHVVIFDMHGEYQSAFLKANVLTVGDINKPRCVKIPCWLLSNEELQELLIESGEEQSYRQIGLLRDAITLNKIKHSLKDGNYDFNIKFSDVRKFSISEVLQFIKNKNKEGENGWTNEFSEKPKDKKPTISHSDLHIHDTEHFNKIKDLFICDLYPAGLKADSLQGKFTSFINRIESKLNDKRFNFLFAPEVEQLTIKDILHQFLSYKEGEKANVTIIDLSGVPFEVLSIVISVISRIIFEYGYFYKKYTENTETPDSSKEMDTPILLVYEEIHKYAPKSEFSKYRSARESIERIVKEGRKYGVSAMIVSQRPSEVSDTIFSQCNNFVAMRLTNPLDQEYIKKLLPDNLGSLVDNLPSLQCGEALLVGEAVDIPSLVKIEKPNPEPKSSDIPYLDHWRKEWKSVDFDSLIETWQ